MIRRFLDWAIGFCERQLADRQLSPELERYAQRNAEQFETATGYPPQDDDLERSNCIKAGDIGHFCCGWDAKRNLPQFISMARELEAAQKPVQADES